VDGDGINEAFAKATGDADTTGRDEVVVTCDGSQPKARGSDRIGGMTAPRHQNR